MDLLDLICSEFEALVGKASLKGIDMADIGEISRLMVVAETAIGRFSAQGFISAEDAKIVFGMLDALRNAMAASKRRSQVVREFNELTARKESGEIVDEQLSALSETFKTIAEIVANQLAALASSVAAVSRVSGASCSTHGQ